MQNKFSSSSGTTRNALPLVPRFSVTPRGLQYLQAEKILDRCGGDFVKAARALGVTRTTLYRYLDRLDLLRTRI